MMIEAMIEATIEKSTCFGKGADKDSFGRSRLTLYSSRDQTKKAGISVPLFLDKIRPSRCSFTDSRVVRGGTNQHTIQRPNIFEKKIFKTKSMMRCKRVID